MNKYEALKEYFGYDRFREGQEQIIDALLSGTDAVAVMPTGAGKSLCFQLPALLLPGITLVVSPLISLMKDHVASLKAAGVAAAYLNSSLTSNQYALAVRNLRAGAYKIVYVAPERLCLPGFLAALSDVTISMLAVDEAHCISQWGQDFRPSYLEIPKFISELGYRPVVGAFTATATVAVKEDISRQLALGAHTELVTGFDRPNLFFEVTKPRDKTAELIRRVQSYDGACGVVYCSTRRAVEEVCATLNDAGISATRYHAGLPTEERLFNQDEFRYDRAPVMVATNAFGMGIDKPGVRFVIHYNMPLDLESYYQEAGRAGRDGMPADCILFYSGKDVQTGKFLIEKGAEEIEDAALRADMLERGYKRLREMTFYCASHGCLRRYILQYFGQKAPTACDNCSVCKDGTEQVDITRDAMLILRCCELTHGRFGAQMIAGILRGADTERIRAFGLSGLEVFGLLTNRSQSQLLDELSYLTLLGVLAENEGQYPTLSAGENAELAQSGDPIMMLRPVSKAPAAPVKKLAQSEDPALFNALCALRKQLATRDRVPAFVICTDATLVDLCRKRPQTLAELHEVSGIGAKKVERYGEDLLKVVRAQTGGGQ